MKRFVVVFPLVAAACSAPEQASGPSTSVTIRTGALGLSAVTDARYRLTVSNGANQTVWTEDITSSQYGDGRGSATYIGTCDADANPNHVALELLELRDAAGVIAADTYRNPGLITRDVTCVENGDVAVDLDVTLLRSGVKGFFDIGVTFGDIFCSAKLDCPDDGLLYNPATGNRALTAVAALACTAGEGTTTALYWGDTAIVCREGNTVVATYPIHPQEGEGQHGPIRSNPAQTPPGVFEHAFYEVDGADTCGWTMGIGLNLATLGPNCTFEATATAAEGLFTAPPFHTPTGAIYPYIHFSVPLTTNGALTCGNNPVDGQGSNVTTGYTTQAGLPFAVSRVCGEGPESPTLACSGADDLTFATGAEGVTVSHNGQTFGPFTLPAGVALADECCVDPCCEEIP